MIYQFSICSKCDVIKISRYRIFAYPSSQIKLSPISILSHLPPIPPTSACRFYVFLWHRVPFSLITEAGAVAAYSNYICTNLKNYHNFKLWIIVAIPSAARSDPVSPQPCQHVFIFCLFEILAPLVGIRDLVTSCGFNLHFPND